MRARALLFLLLALTISAFAQQPATFSQAKKYAIEVYRDHPSEFYCGCSIRREGKKLIPDLESCGYSPRKNAQRAARIEWEHVVPAWEFGHQLQCWQQGGRKNCVKTSAQFRRMEADLHNLVPSVGEVNGDRGNFSYAMLPGEPRVYGACDFEVDFKARKAEPGPSVRGDIARIYFYMRDRYGLRLSKQQTQLFQAWSKMDPVDAWELERNRRIAAIQGVANAYVSGSAMASQDSAP